MGIQTSQLTKPNQDGLVCRCGGHEVECSTWACGECCCVPLSPTPPLPGQDAFVTTFNCAEYCPLTDCLCSACSHTWDCVSAICFSGCRIALHSVTCSQKMVARYGICWSSAISFGAITVCACCGLLCTDCETRPALTECTQCCAERQRVAPAQQTMPGSLNTSNGQQDIELDMANACKACWPIQCLLGCISVNHCFNGADRDDLHTFYYCSDTGTNYKACKSSCMC